MHFTTVLIVGVALVWSQDIDLRRRALEIVKKAKGTVVIDANAPGEPVVALNL